MIFNSVTFIIFLFIVVLLYWILPRQIKMWMLLIASCVFYAFWKWEYLSVMFVSAITDYFTAIAIYKTPRSQKRKRKLLLLLTLFVNIGLLIYFKYLYFFTDNTNSLLHSIGINYNLPLVELILPFGISFYTFETISYTVDVYRGIIKPEKSFVNYGLFVTFFPKLVAGPIQRAAELLEQLKNRRKFSIDFLSEGIKRILYGLFLKVVIADNVSPLVDEGFQINSSQLSALDVWTLAFLFGFQIYLDFSAYSHIAVGSAKLMGITIPENFNFPYIASSFKEFWKRWHISLSSWIRDYLYLPLTGSKVKHSSGKGGIGDAVEKVPNQRKRNYALFITWAIMGLWHGANWTFIFWGLFHATAIFLERLFKPLREKIPLLNTPFTGWVITIPLAMLSWIPFRADNLNNAIIMLGKVVLPDQYKFLNLRENTYLITALLLLLVSSMYFINEYVENRISSIPWFYNTVNVIKYTVLFILVFIFLRPISQFIYFQF